MDDHDYSSDVSISTQRSSATIDDSARVVTNSFLASMVSMLKNYILPSPLPHSNQSPRQQLRISTSSHITGHSPVFTAPSTSEEFISCSSTFMSPGSPLSPVNRPATSLATPDTPDSIAEERRPFHTPSPSPCRSIQETNSVADLLPATLNNSGYSSALASPSTHEVSVAAGNKEFAVPQSPGANSSVNSLIHNETSADEATTADENTVDIHRKYWDCNKKDKVSDACPECGERFSTGWSRRTHYLQLHYDLYFASVTHHEANSVVGRILGSSSETNLSYINWRDEYCCRTRMEDHPAARVCLLCRETPKAMRLYNGPRRLLAHVEKAHPFVARSLRLEYKGVCSRGPHVSNLELHQLLIAPHPASPAPKRRAESGAMEPSPKRSRMETA